MRVLLDFPQIAQRMMFFALLVDVNAVYYPHNNKKPPQLFRYGGLYSTRRVG